MQNGTVLRRRSSFVRIEEPPVVIPKMVIIPQDQRRFEFSDLWPYTTSVLWGKLPKTVWVGSALLSQHAILEDDHGVLEYVMQNNTPCRRPSNVLCFGDYTELQEWVQMVSAAGLQLDRTIEVLEKLKSLTYTFNDEFPDDQLPYIDIQLPDVSDWRVQSVIGFLEEVNRTIQTPLMVHLLRLQNYFISNEFINPECSPLDLEQATLALACRGFKAKLPAWYRTLNTHYNKNLDKLSIEGALSLKSRTRIPLLACIMFLRNIRSVSDEERHRAAMRTRWTSS